MELNTFKDILKKYLKEINIKLDDKQLKKFYDYMNYLIEENKKVNLTAITDPKEIIIKHFVDSLMINNEIKNNSYMIDIGTGAGFPGIPIKIYRDDINMVLLDSLSKRINFLNNVKSMLNLNNIITIHSRVEDFARDKNNKEKFDVVTSRAVASLNVLLEYMLPLTKINGKCICMKGSNIDDELKNSQNALNILGGEIEKIENTTIPFTDIKRNIIIVKKVKNTPNKYPRNAGIPSKKPIKQKI